MKPEWFKVRGYSHFDARVGAEFANSVTPALLEKHAWSPLISYNKSVKRYRPQDGKTVTKERPIMYASHRDACFLSKYAAELNALLDAHYKKLKLTENVIAYRALGKSNYNFSADAYEFAESSSPCVAIGFDVSGFFDTLDHGILKARLKRLLGVKELSKDWYSVFRHVTKFHHIERNALKKHPVFGPRLKRRGREPLATIRDVLDAKIGIISNRKKFGIPQGTPISSALSNAYLVDLDEVMVCLCNELGAFYRRYSDDILIICKAEVEGKIASALADQVAVHKLKLNDDKLERAVFDHRNSQNLQYLGFNISPDGAVIRPGSLSKQWRKAKRSLARTKKIGMNEISKGKASKIYTKKLRRRFSPVGARNFSSYVRRSAEAFGSSAKMIKQVRRLERMVDKSIREIES